MDSNFTTDGLNISFTDRGNIDGLPVIFIHGFPFDKSMWAPQIASLPGNVRPITYDIRGHGQSELGSGYFSIEFLVDDLIALLDHLELDRAVVCGLSMGGYIALRAAERHPERIKAFVLCDTKSTADSDEARVGRAKSMQFMFTHGVDKFADTFAGAVFAPATIKQQPALVEQIKSTIRATDASTIAATLMALAARTDTTASLDQLTCPLLIIVGEQDALTPPSDSEAMLAAAPGATMIVIPDAAHLSNLENPESFNRALLGFLESIN